MTTATVPLTPAEQARYSGLRRFNLVMGFLHLAQGIFMWVVSNGTTYPVYTNFLAFDPATRALAPQPQVLLDVLFGPAVALFLLISAVAHFYLATVGYDRYVANLRTGQNPIRFYEYALSSSLMIVLIGLLAGVWDAGALVAIFAVNASMNLFGIVMEQANQGQRERVNWTAFVYGCLAGIVPWIIIVWAFVTAATSSEAQPPAFVYTIIPVLFVFFNIFALNMWLQYRRLGPWRDYLFGERTYIVLSLAAKSVLAWIIWLGTLAPV